MPSPLPETPQARARLLELLTERAYERKTVTLASGRISDFYIDCRQVALDAEGAALIGVCMLEAVRDHPRGATVAAVGGMTLGADPLATATSVASWLVGAPIPAFIVRKEPKGHGTGRSLEIPGVVPAGGELVVLEDVVTTGGSSLKAAARCREAGFEVRRIIGLVDRLEGGREAIEAEGFELTSVFTRSDFK